MFFNNDNQMLPLRKNASSKRIAVEVADTELMDYQIHLLDNAFNSNSVKLVFVAPTSRIVASHVIKAMWETPDGDEVSVDIHIDNEVISFIACFKAMVVKENIAYTSPSLKEYVGIDFRGKVLNRQTAQLIADACLRI